LNAKSRLLKGENGGVWVGRLTVTRLSDVPAIKNNAGAGRCPQVFARGFRKLGMEPNAPAQPHTQTKRG